MYPFRQHTTEELHNDLLLLRSNLRKEQKRLKVLKCGYIGSNNYFQYERMATKPQNGRAPLDQFKQKGDRLMDYIKKHKRDPFSTLSFLTKACAQFPSSIAGQVYKLYNASFIFDPYAGWGDRLFAAMALDISYVGCDSNINLKEPYEKMIECFSDLITHQPIIHFAKSESINIPIETDLIFSSPPFFYKKMIVESYNDCETDYNTFLKDSLVVLFEKGRGKRIVLHLPQEMYSDLACLVGDCSEEVWFGRNCLYSWRGL